MNVKAILSSIDKKAMARGVIVGVAMTASAAGGYYVAIHKLNQKYQERLNEELDATERFYQRMARQKPDNPVDLARELAADALATYIPSLGETDEEVDEELEVNLNEGALVEISKNIFTNAIIDFDLEEEMKTRGPDKPYIITQGEFMSSDFNSTTLTYFEGDGVLSDERDEHIPDIEGTVGEDNLSRFGHGSHDNNIVYIRNERLDLDFEVIRQPGKYTEQILGFIQHEDKYRPRKFPKNE